MASNQSPTVVIPYKENLSEELDWAKISLKNVECREVLVVGDNDFPKPFWAQYSSSHDQIAKYYYACQVSTSDALILSNDDIFIMAPWKAQNYNKGTLDEHIEERGRMDTYTRELMRTSGWLKKKKYPTLSYELHTPMLVDRRKLKTAINELIPHISKGKHNTVLIRSYYGNKYGIESTFMQDCKNPKDYKGLPILSTSDKTFKGELGDYIKEQLS